jgi:hypothetical protein
MLTSEWALATVKKTVNRYLLVDAERAAAARTAEQQGDIARYFKAANRRYRAAEALADPFDLVSSILLYRASIALYAAAIARMQSAAIATPVHDSRAFDALEALTTDPLPVEPDEFAALRASLSSEDPLVLDGRSAEDLGRLHRTAQAVATWLKARVDPRPVPALRTLRRARIGIAGLAAIALLYALGVSALTPKNIARGKPTTASSRFPGTPDASGATNGEIEAAYGVHTVGDINSWVMVDLEKPTAIREVRVYSRGDGWQDEQLPTVLEVSVDQNNWTTVDIRTTSYSQAQPWIAKVHGPPVRYVRLRRPVRGVVAIAEIEVYK